MKHQNRKLVQRKCSKKLMRPGPFYLTHKNARCMIMARAWTICKMEWVVQAVSRAAWALIWEECQEECQEVPVVWPSTRMRFLRCSSHKTWKKTADSATLWMLAALAEVVEEVHKASLVVLVVCQASAAWAAWVACLVALRKVEEEVEVPDQHLPSVKCDNTILIV